MEKYMKKIHVFLLAVTCATTHNSFSMNNPSNNKLLITTQSNKNIDNLTNNHSLIFNFVNTKTIEELKNNYKNPSDFISKMNEFSHKNNMDNIFVRDSTISKCLDYAFEAESTQNGIDSAWTVAKTKISKELMSSPKF
jgi:hypothetical protein